MTLLRNQATCLPVCGPHASTLQASLRVVCLVLGVISGLPHAGAQAAISIPLSLQSSAVGDVIHMMVGRSMLLKSTNPLRRVYVGNPAVLQTYTSDADELVLTAKSSGESRMVLWDEPGGHRLYVVFADIDPDALRGALGEAFPGSLIHVDAGEGKIFLTGSVATEAASEAAVKMASQYAKDVVNSIRILPEHGKQVQLKLRIVEVDRTRMEQLGINIFAGGRTTVATTTGQFSSASIDTNSSVTVSNPLNIFLYNAKLNLGVTV